MTRLYQVDASAGYILEEESTHLPTGPAKAPFKDFDGASNACGAPGCQVLPRSPRTGIIAYVYKI